MKRNVHFLLMLLLSVTLVACNSNTANDLNTEDIKEMVHEYSVGNFTNVNASITSDELIINEGGKETTYKLPNDEFFVSIAPFIEQTHT